VRADHNRDTEKIFTDAQEFAGDAQVGPI